MFISLAVLTQTIAIRLYKLKFNLQALTCGSRRPGMRYSGMEVDSVSHAAWLLAGCKTLRWIIQHAKVSLRKTVFFHVMQSKHACLTIFGDDNFDDLHLLHCNDRTHAENVHKSSHAGKRARTCDKHA